MVKGQYYDAICDFTHALSFDDSIGELYKLLAECYRALAERTDNELKKKEYVTFAEADEKKYEELNTETHE